MGKLLPEIPDRYRALVATAAYTGMRWGECVGLHWQAVDLDARRLRVVRVLVEVAAGSHPGRIRRVGLAVGRLRCRCRWSIC